MCFVGSRKVSKPRDWVETLSYRCENWQASRQQHWKRNVILTSKWQHMCYSDCCRFTGLTLILARISNRMASKMWGKITYAFPNFNGAAVEVWGWIRNFVPYFVMDVITFAITYFIALHPKNYTFTGLIGSGNCTDLLWWNNINN